MGTRNYIAVISTVNCSASTSRYIAERFHDGRWKAEFPNVDGVFAITHKGGCGLPFEGMDHQILERVLAGFANHPNVAAYVIVGLGCEGAYAQHLVETQHLTLLGPAGMGTAAIDRAAAQAPRAQYPGGGGHHEDGRGGRPGRARADARGQFVEEDRAAGLEDLPGDGVRRIGRQLGRHGQSGARGRRRPADRPGGTAVLGETTEIYGAEHLLTRRAVTREVGEKLVERIKWWEWYTGIFGAQIDNNPSPGNKAGGLTTIYEKSLGALAKAGSTALVDVVEYAAQVDKPGLIFMDTPGYDPPCTTGLVAGGANVLVFTTGRGSVLGLKPTPCIKLATNTPMYERMIDDMDMDAGTILEGEPVAEVGQRLFDLILDVASGTRTKSEQLGVGEEEFAPWTIGPTL